MKIKPLWPGVWLMRSLRLPYKLALLSSMVLIPLILLSWQFNGRVAADIEFSVAEREGVAAIQQVTRAVALLHKLRDAPPGAGVTASAPELKVLAAGVAQALTGSKLVALSAQWTPLAERIKVVAEAREADTARPARQAELVDDLRRFIYSLAEASNLLFDPDAITYLLIDMGVSRLVPWAEKLLWPVASGLSPENPAQLLAAADGLAAHLRDIRFAAEFLKQRGQTDMTAAAAVGASQALEALLRQAATSGGLATVGGLVPAQAQALNAVAAYQAQVLARVDQLLVERVEGLKLERSLSLTATTIGIGLLMYLLLAFHASFITDFGQLMKCMQSTATGNLRTDLQVRGKDELGQMAHLLIDMNRRMSMMVADVQTNSALVAHVGHCLVGGNRDLSDRTEQQAASLQQTAASVQQMSATVQQNAQTALTADGQAAQVRDAAEAGVQSMELAVSAVEGIQKSAHRMSEIIGVIDGLAFQTNILALNAAVEAARAGEQGKGFSVVAAEVRNLAQRSAESAKEIRQLIEASTNQVADSVARIRKAGGGIGQVASGIRGVAANMSRISLASNEQSNGLGEISSSVQQLDGITQRNAKMVERAVEQATSLEKRARQLATVASAFRLQQGTADEAFALMERAVAHRETTTREGFVRDLTALDFHDRDMYVFALDAHGTYRAFGGNPAKVGTRVQDIPGIRGDELVHGIVTQAEEEPGWVEYGITNPATGVVQMKMSYVTKVDDLYVGCGVYKSLALAA